MSRKKNARPIMVETGPKKMIRANALTFSLYVKLGQRYSYSSYNVHVLGLGGAKLHYDVAVN